MTDEDEDSKRVSAKMDALEIRTVQVFCKQDKAASKWYVRTALDTSLDERERRGVKAAAEGTSLKEALMNLADKLTM